MVDWAHSNGKKSDNQPGHTLVVAGALRRQDGRWLMHCRPLEKHHGGLWEFPGGKVESGEAPVIALIRELREELGVEIDPSHICPIAFSEERQDQERLPIVILLYTVADWVGTPTALEGGRIDWFTPEDIEGLDKPPLDHDLVRQIFGDQPVDRA